MTPPKTITQIQLEHGLCHCHEAYKSRDMDDPDCPMHSSAIEEAMEAWGEIRAVGFAKWAMKYSVGNSFYYGLNMISTSRLYAIYIKETNKP